tara:strand:- start:937 stop:1557 length:621 start_codon:yes stop_codon:yes gene_type:complete
MRYEPKNIDESIIAGVPPEKGSVESLDPFSTPIPGQSLTMRPGSQAFEKPWVYTDPDECLVFLIEKLEQDRKLKEEHLSILASGVPVEYMVNTTAFAGFTEGLWSPDTAELIKPGLAMYYILVAMDENVPFVLFNSEGEQEGQLNDKEILDSMKNLHPEAYGVITERMDAAQRPAPEPEGFLDMPAEDVEEIQEEEVLMDEKEGMI